MNKIDLYKVITYNEDYYFSNEVYPAESFWKTIDGTKIQEGWGSLIKESKKDAQYGLHINIPFCEKKCRYCTHSVSIGNTIDIEKYLSALEKEMQSYTASFQDVQFSSLYIGGGTPTLLSGEQIQYIYTLVKKYFNIGELHTNMLEFSPNTATEEKIQIAAKNGVNRVTFGIQDINSDVLSKNGRTQTIEQIVFLIQSLQKNNINFINVDIMAGLPFQTLDHFKSTLDFALGLPVSNICLNIFKPTNESNLQDTMVFDAEYFKKRDDMISYWRNEYSHKEGSNVEEEDRGDLYPFDAPLTSFLGLGYGANSRIHSRLCYKKSSLLEYLENNIKYVGYTLSVEEEIVKYILLRLKESGISFSEIQSLFGIDAIPEKIIRGIDFLNAKGLLDSFEKEGILFFRFKYPSDLLYALYTKIFYPEEIIKHGMSEFIHNQEKYGNIDHKLKYFYIA